MTPFARLVLEAREVLSDLMRRMMATDDTKLFRNIAAVYVIWQHELHTLELESLNYGLVHQTARS